MMTRKVTDDDHFINLSSSAQALYLHLSMSADDDGFCNQVSSCMFRAHASMTDLQALLDNRYLLQFESGVIVIKHWRMANSLRKDRYTPTRYKEEFAQLAVKDTGAYTLKKDGCQMVANGLPDGCQMVAERLPQYNSSKDKISKVNTSKERAAGKPRTRMDKTERNLSTLEALTGNGVTIPEGIYPQVVEWLKYKGERGDTYTERGLKALLKLITSYVDEYGVAAVSALIDECAGNEYRGIIWDKLTKGASRAQKRQEADLFAMIREEEKREQSGNNESYSNPAGGIPNFL